MKGRGKEKWSLHVGVRREEMRQWKNSDVDMKETDRVGYLENEEC